MYQPLKPFQANAFVTNKLRVAIIHTAWHTSIISALVEGAKKTCLDQGVAPENIDVFEVAGSFELPQMANHLARRGHYGAIIPIGCLIKGETIHFEIIAQTVTRALDEVARENDVPISLGVITVNTMEQALARAGGELGNKGSEAAIAALELAQHFSYTH
ncbi:MAG: 6,7-dimethyl-8-ribityllumazine synthase [Bdellovibrionota bacterium]